VGKACAFTALISLTPAQIANIHGFGEKRSVILGEALKAIIMLGDKWEITGRLYKAVMEKN